MDIIELKKHFDKYVRLSGLRAFYTMKKRQGDIEFEIAVSYFAAVLDGTEYLHNVNLIDMGPHNFMGNLSRISMNATLIRMQESDVTIQNVEGLSDKAATFALTNAHRLAAESWYYNTSLDN